MLARLLKHFKRDCGMHPAAVHVFLHENDASTRVPERYLGVTEELSESLTLQGLKRWHAKRININSADL